ncbi:hypothetical protein Acr_01g0004940 [Actinidia rufa]|uniref:Retrotransposon gag domain-containing protein n=1 Tax=Actinidia rufa TaxID=165716 RepID=A0A7J0E2F0_9ERIC|nr:hypothetical protein Acr_01g0004940 [Actinidia rufa]
MPEGVLSGLASAVYFVRLCKSPFNRYLPRPSASSPLVNRAHPMANPGQVPDLEGLHREIHDMAEQMRIMNENNGRLMQLLTTANPQLPAAPPVPDIERSRHFNQSSKTPARARRGRSPHRGDHIEARTKSTSQKIRDLDARLDAINTGTNALVTVDALIRQTEPPFIERVLRDRISSNRLFIANFMSCRNRQKNASHLFTVHQKETESLKDFVKRFNQAILDVEDPSDKSKSDKYIATEELAEAKRRHLRTPARRPEFILPPLNAPVAQVLSEMKYEEFVKWPEKIKTDPQKRNQNKYCEFHWDHGHNTEDCFQPKEQIVDLIKRGYLRKYVVTRPPPNSPERRYGDNRPTAGNIQTIHRGFGSGGCLTSSKKKHARSAPRLAEEEIYNLSSSAMYLPWSDLYAGGV